MDGSEVNFREYKGFILRRTDPYGFWHVEKAVKELQGSFTNLSAIKTTVDVYLSNQKKAEKIRK